MNDTTMEATLLALAGFSANRVPARRAHKRQVQGISGNALGHARNSATREHRMPETTLSHLLLSAYTSFYNWERMNSEWGLERC